MLSSELLPTLNDVISNKNVAIYARVSTTEQAEEGYSIDEQVRLLNDWCQQQGYNVYQTYTDRGISGKSIEKRPALKQMLADVSQKKFDIVLVWKTNRLARNILDLLKMIDLFDNNNIAFRSYTENHETETAGGSLQLQVMAAFAEYERKNIAENVKMGMIARAKEGSWNGGQVLGYDTVEVPGEIGKKKHTKLIINEKESQTVKRIFQLYLEGNGYKSIANTVNKEGHRSKKNNTFSINAIKTILTNPIYAGYIRYNVRRNWTEKRRNNINPNPIIEKGHHSPIISEDDWQKAKSILASRSRTPNRVHSGEFLLTGILKCPCCGAGMVLSRTTNPSKKDGSKKVIEYYACGNWKNKGTIACHSNAIRVGNADKYVLNKIAKFTSNDRIIKEVVKKINNRYKSNINPVQNEYNQIKKLIAQVQVSKDKILGLYEKDRISEEDLNDRLIKLNDEKKVLEERLSPLAIQLNERSQKEISFEMVKEVMTNFEKNYKEAITTEQRKHLLQLLINKITITDRKKIDTIQIQYNNQVVQHFENKGEEKSSDDDFSSPFCVYIDIP